MADPRASVSWKGFEAVNAPVVVDNSTITYSATATGGSSQVGLAVNFSADAKVIQLVGDAEFVLGKLISVESDLRGNVQVKGHMTLPAGSGVASLTLGKKIIGDLGAASAEGYIREVDTAVAAELGLARGYALDDATLTAVEIYLP